MRNLFTSILFLAIGLGLAWWGKGYLADAQATAKWPTVEGTVLETRIHTYKSTSGSGSKKRTTTMYEPIVVYRYEVDGKTYTHDQVEFASGGSSSASSAKKTIHRYPVGSKVTVYYDPELPQNALLEPGAKWYAYMPLGFGVLFALVGGLTFIRSIFRGIGRLLGVVRP